MIAIMKNNTGIKYVNIEEISVLFGLLYLIFNSSYKDIISNVVRAIIEIINPKLKWRIDILPVIKITSILIIKEIKEDKYGTLILINICFRGAIGIIFKILIVFFSIVMYSLAPLLIIKVNSITINISNYGINDGKATE